MKKITILLLIFLCVSCFAQNEIVSEKYKSKKVTISSAKMNLKDLLESISNQTELKLIAGENGDWRVSERDIACYCENASLESVLQSISYTTKLIWNKQDDDTLVLIYDPNTDLFINNLNVNAENNRNKQREQALNNMFSEVDDLEGIKEDDPIKYLLNSTGLDKSIEGIVDNIPGVRQALTSGSSMTINGSSLSEEAVNNINLSSNILKETIKDGIQKRSDVKNKHRVLQGIDKIDNQLPKDLSRVTIEVNGDGTNIPGGKAVNNILLGSAVIKIDGKVKGFIPMVDTQNPMVKKFGAAMVELYENPNANPAQVFASIGGADILKDLNNSVNNKVYDDMKMEIPSNPFFDRNIKLDSKPISKANAIELLSKAIDFPCTCDDFSNLMDMVPGNIRTEGTVKDIIFDINNAYGLTMAVGNNQLSFYSIKWFEEIQKLMPVSYLNKWKEQYVKDEFISLDSLYEMSDFSAEQLGYGFGKFSELNSLSKSVIPNLQTIRFLSKINPSEYEYITGSGGVRVSALTNRSYDLLCEIPKLREFAKDNEGIIKVSMQKFDDNETIMLIASKGDMNFMPIMIQIKLDKYKPITIEGGKIPSNVPKNNN